MNGKGSGYYDSSKVRLVVSGIDITGFSDGEKVKIEPVTKEDIKSHVGVDGDYSFAVINDKRYTVSFSLKQGSPSNAYLYALLKSRTPVVVSVNNTSEGGYIGGGIDGRIIEKPAITFAAEDSKREWKILIPEFSDVMMTE